MHGRLLAYHNLELDSTPLPCILPEASTIMQYRRDAFNDMTHKMRVYKSTSMPEDQVRHPCLARLSAALVKCPSLYARLFRSCFMPSL